MVTHQLQVERRTGKVRRPETDVLPLCHATNNEHWLCVCLDAPAAASSSRRRAAAAGDSACVGVACRHGAVCDVTQTGRPVCRCPFDCSSTTDNSARHSTRSASAAVCGTDGRRYASLCQLILHACRTQRRIHPSLANRC